MNFTDKIECTDAEVELKYCERCGGLFLRLLGASLIYCGACKAHWAHCCRQLTDAALENGPGGCDLRSFLRAKLNAEPELALCGDQSPILGLRCGHVESNIAGRPYLESRGPGETVAVGIGRFNRNGPLAIPLPHHRAASPLCPSLGRGRPVAVPAGRRNLSRKSNVVLGEEFRRCRDLCRGYGALT